MIDLFKIRKRHLPLPVGMVVMCPTNGPYFRTLYISNNDQEVTCEYDGHIQVQIDPDSGSVFRDLNTGKETCRYESYPDAYRAVEHAMLRAELNGYPELEALRCDMSLLLGANECLRVATRHKDIIVFNLDGWHEGIEGVWE